MVPAWGPSSHVDRALASLLVPYLHRSTASSPGHACMTILRPAPAGAAGTRSVVDTGPVVDVRHGSSGDEEVRDIYAYGAGLHSTKGIVGLSEFTHLQSLSLHGNQIERIEGLEVLHHLVSLNLSSNLITWMEGLSHLTNLTLLNLSTNRIREIAGLHGLLALRTLILSHNHIHLLGGLAALHGPQYALQHLDLRDNAVEYLCELWVLGGCCNLEELLFQCGGYTNPVCAASAYRPTLLSLVPRLVSLDGSSSSTAATDYAPAAVPPSLWAIHHSYAPAQLLQSPKPYSLSNPTDFKPQAAGGRRHEPSHKSQAVQVHQDSQESNDDYCGLVKPKKCSRNRTTKLWLQRRDDPGDLDDAATVSDEHVESRFVRFVGRNSCKSMPLRCTSDQKTETTRELATQTEPASLEVNGLQSNVSTIQLVVIDGTSSGIGKPSNLMKETELLHLNHEKKLLENEFAAFKKLVRDERIHLEDNHKSMALRTLAMNLQRCKLELRSLRRTVTESEKEVTTQVKLVESSIIKHVVLEDAIRLSASSAEILALKEALNSALNTCQTVGTALNDANHQKEKAKRTLVSLTAALDEQRTKAKTLTEMLESCTQQERQSSRECDRLSTELDMVSQTIRKSKDREMQEVIKEQSTVWQARGREEAQKKLHRRLLLTQTTIRHVFEENAKAVSSVSKLREMMIEKMSELRTALEAITEKDRGATELITELSYVVSAQKKRSEWMQLEMDRLSASKQAVSEEAERLEAERVRLQERSNAAEAEASEAEALRRQLAKVTSNGEHERRCAKDEARAHVSSLLFENENLAARASSLTHTLEETHNLLMAKSEVCESQKATIQQLKDELVEAHNAASTLETDMKLLEADLLQRLQDEVDQKHELRDELSVQETIISDLEEELRITKIAKHGAEQTCKSLQEKVKDVDTMLRHVDGEISSIKTLYEDREKSISLERDDALAKVAAMQKKLEEAEVATTVAMQAHFETTKQLEAKDQKLNNTLIQKDILIEDLKRKNLEVEAQLHSCNLALETQKSISAAKVEQMGKVLEELREIT